MPAGRRTARTPLRAASSVGISLAFVGIAAFGVATAAVPDPSTGVFHGCVRKATGVLRVIDPAKAGLAGHCLTAAGLLQESAITFDQSGPSGAVGPAGVAGAPGAAGEQGPPGVLGLLGPAGFPGLPGADGTPGHAGQPGADGANGADGSPGSAGAPGPSGPTGAAGEAGISGSPGPVGPAGDVGPTGVVGPAGPSAPYVVVREETSIGGYTYTVDLPPATYVVYARCVGGTSTNFSAQQRRGQSVDLIGATCNGTNRALGVMRVFAQPVAHGVAEVLPVDVTFIGSAVWFTFTPVSPV